MAIFAKMPSLLSELLDYGADPNTTLSKADHSFTPLLILTILQPAYENSLMAEALLKAKANPSSRADPYYRQDLMERLSRNRAPEYLDNSQGVTALHLLAIRVDMDTDVDGFEALIRVFYKDGCIKSSDLYQGHSPLSLAIVEGNLTAAKTFLKTKFIDVNEQLGADLGSAMLMLESCALQRLLPPDLLQEFLELLLEYGGCPFASANAFGEEYNQIEYGRKELTKMLTVAESSVKVKEKKRKSKSRISSKSSKETIMMENFTRSMDFIKKIAQEKLIRWIKENFVKDLINSPVMFLPVAKQSSVFLKEPLFNYALNWMTEEDLASVMKTMNCSRDNVTELVRLFVSARVLTQQKNSSDVNTIVQIETEEIMNKGMPLVDKKQEISASVNSKLEKIDGEKETNDFEAEFNLESNKFKVCFECFGVHGKILIACPKCRRIYFCSEECNSKNTEREANPHRCPIFYHNEWTRMEKIATTFGIDATSYMLEIFQNPEKFIDLEEKIRRSKEGGKRSSKYRNENTCNGKSKYRQDECAVYKKLQGSNYKTNRAKEGDQPADKIEYDYNREENGVKRTAVKKTNEKPVYEKDDVNNNIANENNENDDDDDRKVHRSKLNDEVIKDISDRKKSLKDSKKCRENDGEKATGALSVKVKNEKKKNRHRLTINKKVVNDETEMQSEKGDQNKKEESIIVNEKVPRTGSDGVKLKKGKKKGHLFDENKLNEKNSKFKIEKANLRNKTEDQRANELRRNNYAIVNNEERQGEGSRYKKREWDNRRNKKTRERDSNTWKNKAKVGSNNIEKNSAQTKYLNWLSKMNKSVKERLDIDILLLPYVVFAQGDTYFRILPANQFPKHKGNYSLI